MKAVLVTEFNTLPQIASIAAPETTSTGAIIRVHATGLCRSDWHGWMGHDPGIRLPHVPGHEFAGIIESVGDEVRNWRPGDRVTVPFVCACGRCEQCALGQNQVCDNQMQPGFDQWGSFAELVSVQSADTNLIALPEDIDFVAAAALGCRFATAYRAVMTQGRVRSGEWVVVHGCGGVGASAIMIALAAGARVIAVDVSATALSFAADLGAIPVPGDTDAVEAIRTLTGGGAHLSLDAYGSAATSANSIGCLRKRGRHVQVGLMVGADAIAPVPMDKVIANELEILGSHGMAAHEYPAMLALIASGTIDPRKLVGRTISLEEAPNALSTMDNSGLSGMTVIEIPHATRAYY